MLVVPEGFLDVVSHELCARDVYDYAARVSVLEVSLLEPLFYT